MSGDAQRFTALGRGNGFPFCPHSYEYISEWLPFMSLVKFPGDTQFEQLINGMNFFWLLKSCPTFKFDFSIYLSQEGKTEAGSFLPVHDIGFGLEAEDDILSLYKPHERVCPPGNLPGLYGAGRETIFSITLQSNLMSDKYGELGKCDVFFDFGYDENGDLNLLYLVRGYVDENEQILAISNIVYGIAYNSVFVPIRVGKNVGDVVNLKIYGLFIGNSSDHASVLGGEISSEFWEFE